MRQLEFKPRLAATNPFSLPFSVLHPRLLILLPTSYYNHLLNPFLN